MAFVPFWLPHPCVTVYQSSRATAALRGEDDSQLLGKGIALLIGVGIGVGIGVLIAPASGDETQDDIANKVSEFSDKVRERAANRRTPP